MIARLTLAVLIVAGGAQVVMSEAEQLTQSGNSKLSRGDVAAAASDYRKALMIDGRAFEARVNLGAALLQLGDVQGAVDTLEAAVKTRPDSALALRNLGRAYLRAEQWSDALEVLQKAEKRERHRDNDRLLGIALHRAGQSAKAIPRLERAVETQGSDLELLVELASAEVSVGSTGATTTIRNARKLSRKKTESGDRTGQARIRNQLGVLLRRTGDTKGAIGELQAAVALDPSYTPAHANLGVVLVEAGQAKSAVSSLRAAVKNDSDPQLRFLLGRALLAAGNAKAAIEELKKARSWGYDPREVAAELAAAYEKTGNAKAAAAQRKIAGIAPALSVEAAAAKEGTTLLNQGEFAKAEQLLAKAAAKYDDDGGLYFNLGLARLHLDDPQGALAPLESAARLLPKESRVHYHLGAARDLVGDYSGAAAAWEKFLTLDKTPRPDVNKRLGRIYLEQEKNAPALRHLEKAVKGLPESLETQYDLAVVYLRLGKSKRALAPLSRVIKAQPKDTEARAAYADALYANQQYEEAAKQYAVLVKQEPRVARHRVNLAVSYRAAGNRDAEKKALHEAAQLAPDDAVVWADLGRLQFQDQEWKLAAASFTRAAALDPTDQLSRENAETARKNESNQTNAAARNKEWAEIQRTHLHLGVVITKDEAVARTARKEILAGKDFKAIAKARSVHETAAAGGDLGWQHPDQLPAFAGPAKKLKRGEVSAVVPIQGGFAVFYRFKD